MNPPASKIPADLSIKKDEKDNLEKYAWLKPKDDQNVVQVKQAMSDNYITFMALKRAIKKNQVSSVMIELWRKDAKKEYGDELEKQLQKKVEKEVEHHKRDANKTIKEIRTAAESDVDDAKRLTQKLQDRVDELEARFIELFATLRNRKRPSSGNIDNTADNANTANLVDVDEEIIKKYGADIVNKSPGAANDTDTIADFAVRLEIEEKERLLAAGVKIEDDLVRYKPILATTKILKCNSTNSINDSKSIGDTSASVSVKRLYFIVTGMGAAISEEENEGSRPMQETIEGFILGTKPPPKLDGEKFCCYWAGQLLNHEKLPEERRFTSIQDCKDKCALLYPDLDLSTINSLKDFFIIIDNYGNHTPKGRRQPVSIDWLLTKDVPQSKIGLSRTCMHLSEEQTQICKDKSYLSRYSPYFNDSFFLSYF